jgi:hypothetical protein
MRWSDIPWTPPERTLRQFAGLWLFVFLALTTWQGFGHGRWGWAVVAAVLALAVGPLGLLRPRAVRPVYVTWMVLAFPAGWLVAQLVLLGLFYGLFTPLGWILWLARHDALALRRPAGRESYWAEKPQATEASRYFRQY